MKKINLKLVNYVLKIFFFTCCYMSGIYWVGQQGNTEWIYFGLISLSVYIFTFMIFKYELKK